MSMIVHSISDTNATNAISLCLVSLIKPASCSHHESFSPAAFILKQGPAAGQQRHAECHTYGVIQLVHSQGHSNLLHLVADAGPIRARHQKWVNTSEELRHGCGTIRHFTVRRVSASAATLWFLAEDWHGPHQAIEFILYSVVSAHIQQTWEDAAVPRATKIAQKQNLAEYHPTPRGLQRLFPCTAYR